VNVTYLKDRSYRPAYVKTTEALLPYDLGDMLVGALWLALSEPLDDPQFDDMDEEQRARLQETY
jgi:hypothetical protein